MTTSQLWRAWRRSIAVGAIVGCGVAPAMAQDSRISLLDAARDARAAEITPLERSSLDRKLYWYDNQDVMKKLFAGWNGIHPGGGDFQRAPA